MSIINPAGTQFKSCGACKERKPTTEFYIRRVRGKVLPSTYCKVCVAQKSKENYLSLIEQRGQPLPERAPKLRPIGLWDQSGPIVYFIRHGEDGPIKIGIARNLSKRLATLQSGTPINLLVIGTILGGRDIERHIHARFAHIRLRGEWFEPTKELLNFIKSTIGSNSL